jgi:hypothetical protein
MIVDDDPMANCSPWSYAAKAWGLTDCEADILFGSDSTFDEQFDVLERMERGEEVKYEESEF